MVSDQHANIPEEGHEITHTIYDKSGVAYTIEGHLSPSVLLSFVIFEGRCVGCINWTISDTGVMTIADLTIREPLDIKPLWARVLPFLYRKQPVSYKGRGLGSAMLNFIIESARAMGVSEINGWITGDDREATPYLPEFYRKHGFMVKDDMRFFQVLG